jgi:hypothetical protein
MNVVNMRNDEQSEEWSNYNTTRNEVTIYSRLEPIKTKPSQEEQKIYRCRATKPKEANIFSCEWFNWGYFSQQTALLPAQTSPTFFIQEWCFYWIFFTTNDLPLGHHLAII